MLLTASSNLPHVGEHSNSSHFFNTALQQSFALSGLYALFLEIQSKWYGCNPRCNPRSSQLVIQGTTCLYKLARSTLSVPV